MNYNRNSNIYNTNNSIFNKGLNALFTVYLDLKHCGLEQCNGSLTLTTKSCKGSEVEVEISFH